MRRSLRIETPAAQGYSRLDEFLSCMGSADGELLGRVEVREHQFPECALLVVFRAGKDGTDRNALRPRGAIPRSEGIVGAV